MRHARLQFGMTTLAAAGKQLEEINKKKSILPKKATKVEKATLAKINEVKKQINLNKQSNADIFSQDSGSCSSEEEDDFIDRDCEEEKHGPLAHLSSSSSGFSLEEEDDDDNGSMTLSSESEEKEKEKPWRAAGKRPRSLEEIRAATQPIENKKRKIESLNTENDEKLRRMEQLSVTLKANIKEYERLRQVTSNAMQQVEEALVQLEAKEKSCEKATLFVINQDQVKKDDEALKKREQKLKEADEALQKREQTLFERVEGLDQRDTQMRNETKEMTERLNQKTEELAQREKTIAANQEIAVNQFKEESDRKLKELDQKAAELEKREKALQQQPQQPKLSILEGFRAEMHKTQQNTLTKEMLMNIMPPILMSNITALTLRANTPIYKTYSMSNGKYILLDIENAEGMPLLSQVIAKDLYNVK